MQDDVPLEIFARMAGRKFINFVKVASRSAYFNRVFAVSSLLILVATTLLWSVLGARLQAHNADQLSDAYLFSSSATLHGATFPGAHTFLLKWPIFGLMGVYGISAQSLLVATVAVVLVTVLALAILLYRLDRRPLVFGTTCLGLSLALLLVPAQPYAGGILPVNMAMLTTRNLEYIVYIVALILFATARRVRGAAFIGGVIVLSALVASDKLFLSLSMGGALIALLIYGLKNNWNMVAYSARWLAGSILAAIGSSIILAVITVSHITRLSSGASVNPYGLAQGAKDVVLGVIYAFTGVLTNVGANPAYDNRLPAHLPQDLVRNLLSWRAPAYLVALALALFALVVAWRMVWASVHSETAGSDSSKGRLLSLSLLWSGAAAIIVFIATNHYYAVDARYLTIWLFALVITVTVWLRTHTLERPDGMIYVSCGMLFAILIAIFTTVHIGSQQTAAFNDIDTRNQLISDALSHHKVDVLVADYWRALPIKLAAKGSLNTLPLATCTQPITALSSTAWQPDLTKHSFAYLITLDGSQTNFPQCSLTQITAMYGRPRSTQVISGTIANPKEALLFYDLGAHHPVKAAIPTITKDALAPIALRDMSDTSCDKSTTMNIVAHEDDDILFMNPDLQHDLQAGRCVRTVYLTAGDAGANKLYWVSRQLGAEAAYSSLLGLGEHAWQQQTVTLGPREYATVATAQGNSKVSLIFLNLPDGNLLGQGFPSAGYQSLASLYSGRLGALESVDSQSSYTTTQLVAALSSLMGAYEPAAIHTQADVLSSQYPDHSDHITTGKIAIEAVNEYDSRHFGGNVAIPVTRYIGYPVHGYRDNVSADDLIQKEAAFLAYAQYDGGVCHTIAQCAKTPTYGAYIARQYTESASER